MRALYFSFVIASGCGGLGDLLGTNTTADGGTTTTSNGFTTPTVEITINGSAHLGPTAPAVGSSATYANVSNGSVITSSTVSIVAATTGGTCAFSFSRFASYGISPIGAQDYNVETAGDAITADNTVSPVGNIAVTANGGNASCAGDACDGSAFSLSHIGADYIEGYWIGNVTTPDQTETDQVTCSFYITTTSFSD